MISKNPTTKWSNVKVVRQICCRCRYRNTGDSPERLLARSWGCNVDIQNGSGFGLMIELDHCVPKECLFITEQAVSQ